MQVPARTELSAASVSTSPPTNTAVDNSVPLATGPQSTYTSGKVFQKTASPSIDSEPSEKSEEVNDRARRPIRLAILQRVCPSYRVALFRELASQPEFETVLFIGDDIPNSKIKNSDDLTGIKYRRLVTSFITLNRQILQPWHKGLLKELRTFDPDVILCEGESHFFGYLQAIIFKIFFSKRVGLLHWCYISLPGWDTIGGGGIRGALKAFFRRFFDGFLVYSSFSKESLIKLGQTPNNIFVATNVCDTEYFLKKSRELVDDIAAARRRLGLRERFTVLYIGTLDENKRPDLMLELADQCSLKNINFVLLGSGPLLEIMRERCNHDQLGNVYLPGRVVQDLHLYYRASDVLLIPGRGGIVISEAMAFGLPVIVHKADGTEFDLVQDKITGMHLNCGDADDFRRALEFILANPLLKERMGHASRGIVSTRFNTKNMVDQIMRATLITRNRKTIKSPSLRGISL
jgi:glycosyltransferase involved in cell wall biosynthesis